MNTGAGTTTLRTGNYRVVRAFGMYRVFKRGTNDYVAQAPSMRKARNIVRNLLAGKAPTTEGIE